MQDRCATVDFQAASVCGTQSEDCSRYRRRSAQLKFLALYFLIRCTAADPELSAINTMKFHPEDHWPIGPMYFGSMSNYGGPYDGVPANLASSTPTFGIKEGGCGYGYIDPLRYPWIQAAAFDPTTPIPEEMKMPQGSRFLCGTCWRITCNATGVCPYEQKSIVVLITDICPECFAKFGNPYHLDVHFSTFAAIADIYHSPIPITVQRVACNPPSNFTIQLVEYHGPPGFLKILVKDGAVYAMIVRVLFECQQSDGSTLAANMTQILGAQWQMSSTYFTSYCRFQVWDDAGRSLTTQYMELTSLPVGRDIDTGLQFTWPSWLAPPPKPSPQAVAPTPTQAVQAASVAEPAPAPAAALRAAVPTAVTVAPVPAATIQASSWAAPGPAPAATLPIVADSGMTQGPAASGSELATRPAPPA